MFIQGCRLGVRPLQKRRGELHGRTVVGLCGMRCGLRAKRIFWALYKTACADGASYPAGLPPNAFV